MPYLYSHVLEFNTMRNTLFTLFIALLVTTSGHSQVSEGGVPTTFKLKKQGTPLNKNYLIEEFNQPDMAAIASQDFDASVKGKPYRVARNIPVNLSIENSGTWSTLSNGDKIWRLGIKIPGAKALSLYFDETVSIPENGKLHAYNFSHSQYIGAYTSNTPGFMAMEMVEGEVLTLEYYMPKMSQNFLLSTLKV